MTQATELSRLLKQGSQSWNQWRKDSPDERPCLEWFNLNQSKMRDIDLSGAGLHHTICVAQICATHDLISPTFATLTSVIQIGAARL